MSETIIAKIAKLFRLSKSPHPAEAEAALAKAMELAARHGLDVAACAEHADARQARITELRTPHRRWSAEAREARFLVERHFGATVVDGARAHGELLWIGTLENLAIAQHVYGFAQEACRRCMRSSRVRIRTANQRKGFVYGFFRGIDQVLSDAPIRNDPAVAGIVVADQASRERYLAKIEGIVSKPVDLRPDRLAMGAAACGYDAGRNTSVRRAVDGAARFERPMIGTI